VLPIRKALRRTLLILLICSTFAFVPAAHAGGGKYVFSGGTPKQQATVSAGLEVSSFDWGLIPRAITIHIGPYGGDTYSTYGNVYLDQKLLETGRFSWGVVQHEMGHQVDFFLLDDAKRAQLLKLLGGKDWCYSISGLKHSEYGCERFASELAWAYWQSPDNTMRPTAPSDEAAAMPVALFRLVLSQLIGAPSTAAALTSATPQRANAPATAAKAAAPRRRR
jgi:hypothetical protein